MPSIWNKEVVAYKVDVFASTTLNYDRSIRLELEDDHTVSLHFPVTAPSDFISIGSSFSTIQFGRSLFDELYHLLQTEAPVFFTAYEFGSLRFAGLTTDEEATGEGFQDPNA